jgi:hypothetical protein
MRARTEHDLEFRTWEEPPSLSEDPVSREVTGGATEAEAQLVRAIEGMP